jgi:hypothetical protein
MIRKNYIYLLETIQPVNLLHHLIDGDEPVLEMHEFEAIESKETITGKNEKLLDILFRKARKKFDLFLDKLRQSEQGHVVDTIQGEEFAWLLTLTITKRTRHGCLYIDACSVRGQM